MTARLIAGCTIAALWQAAGHWQPLSESYKRPSVPRRLFAYVYGVLGILLGLAVATDNRTAARALAVSASAGAATVGAYVVDKWLHGHYGCES